ncbi:ArsR/SmtB family transcription factor [Angustibacter sp. McL0619]|uniref:ArsR/SmtB family transcription factor n=1 Tax=Angustibacter sp. McL0619 TaxID=3415676 RepID=UPI003CE6967F
MEAFAALADDTRRQIVELLAHGDQPAGAIAERFTVSRPAVSRHLRVLREAGLVQVEPRGTQRVYALTRERFDELADWLDDVRRFWDQRLDALGTEVSRGRRTDGTAPEGNRP